MVDWGSGSWYLSRPFGRFTTQSVSFNGSGPTSAALRFVSPRRLVSVQVFNSGRDASTVSISCSGQPGVSRGVARNEMVTIQTGWTGACSSVTLGSTNGWQTNFDNFAIDRVVQIVDFDNLSTVNQPLNGQYPSNVIDWGTDAWFLSGPYGAFTTRSISFNGPRGTSASLRFVSPRTLVRVDAYNGGPTASTLTLSCSGQKTVSVSLAAGRETQLVTGWTAPCDIVTVGSSNGWRTNFDNLAIQ